VKTLHIDIETYSPEPLADCGIYRYAESPDFRILLIAYAVEDEPVQVIDVDSGEKVDWWFIKALSDPFYVKTAHNASFERVCFTNYLRRSKVLKDDEWLDPSQWVCTMVRCLRRGLPASLAEAGRVLGLTQQKMTEGKSLINLFCTPRKARKTTGLFGEDDGRNHAADFPAEWKIFKDYCIRDVEVERQIDNLTRWPAVPEPEEALYALDQRINDRGVLVDRPLASAAVRVDAISKGRLMERAVRLSGLSNPGSVTQLKAWIEERTGAQYTSLTKALVADLIKTTDDDVLREVLSLRLELGKTSVSKYSTMLDVLCKDDRARGLTQFYGSRTGRWAGRLVQLQNLPQNHLDALEAARDCLATGDTELLALNFGNVPDTLSQLVRTAFIAPENKLLAVCDFSAIEARVLAWLAGETWVLETFRAGRDIYCETASRMFRVPVEKHGQNAGLRQKGKVAVLALGYGGGKNALDKMGGARLGMTDQEETDTVVKWRTANPSIVSLWAEIESAAKECCITGIPTKVKTTFARLCFEMQNGTLLITLPSGRKLCYCDMRVGKYYNAKKGGDEVGLHYKGVNQETRKWETTGTFGGKLVENITQAIARDCLALAMTMIDQAGFPIVFHVHDEIVAEVPFGVAAFDLERIQGIFSISPDWAPDLPLKGAGYLTPFYKKD